MLVASKFIDAWRGPVAEEEIRGLVYARHEITADLRQLMGRRLKALEGTWLQKTLLEAPIKPEYPFEVPEAGLPFLKRPGLLVWAYLAVVCTLLIALW